MDSVLLAQLAADKKFSKTEQTAEWYKFYSDVLVNVGWITTGFRCARSLSLASYIAEPCHSFNKVQNAEQSGSVNKIVLELMTILLTGPELALFKLSVESLKGNDGAIRLFDNSAKSGKAADFHAGVCRYVTLFLPAPFNVRLKALTARPRMGTSSSRLATTTTALLRILPTSSSSPSPTQMSPSPKVRGGNLVSPSWSGTHLCNAGNQKMELNTEAYAKVREDVLNKLGNNAQTFVKDLEI